MPAKAPNGDGRDEAEVLRSKISHCSSTASGLSPVTLTASLLVGNEANK